MTSKNKAVLRLPDGEETTIFTSEVEIRKQFLSDHPQLKTILLSIKDTKTVFNDFLLDEGSFYLSKSNFKPKSWENRMIF